MSIRPGLGAVQTPAFTLTGASSLVGHTHPLKDNIPTMTSVGREKDIGLEASTTEAWPRVALSEGGAALGRGVPGSRVTVRRTWGRRAAPGEMKG